MNEKQIEQFKQRIYIPYTEAWEIMKTLRQADLSKDEVWEEWNTKCETFKSKYPSEIGGQIYRVLLDCGSECGRIIRGV